MWVNGSAREFDTMHRSQSLNKRRNGVSSFQYARTTVVLLLSIAAGISWQPSIARDWIDPLVIAAAERMFTAMPNDYFQIRPAAAQQEIAGGAPLLVDVREAGEFKTERIAAARNIPIRELAKSINTLPENKAAPILVYCRSGHRGAIALTVLRMAGYTNVRSVAGGLEGGGTCGDSITRDKRVVRHQRLTLLRSAHEENRLQEGTKGIVSTRRQSSRRG
jgi:rhodanese-related sulfurtransferase